MFVYNRGRFAGLASHFSVYVRKVRTGRLDIAWIEISSTPGTGHMLNDVLLIIAQSGNTMPLAIFLCASTQYNPDPDTFCPGRMVLGGVMLSNAFGLVNLSVLNALPERTSHDALLDAVGVCCMSLLIIRGTVKRAVNIFLPCFSWYESWRR
jgi:hypothetical protein